MKLLLLLQPCAKNSFGTLNYLHHYYYCQSENNLTFDEHLKLLAESYISFETMKELKSGYFFIIICVLKEYTLNVSLLFCSNAFVYLTFQLQRHLPEFKPEHLSLDVGLQVQDKFDQFKNQNMAVVKALSTRVWCLRLQAIFGGFYRSGSDLFFDK